MKGQNEHSESPELEFPERTSDLRAFGQYLDSEPVQAMPTNVWEQIATTLSLESADRVVPDSPAALGSDSAVLELESYRKRRIGGKWVGGLVAASVTLLAVGIGVNVLNSDATDQNLVVAGAQSESAQAADTQIADTGSLAAVSPQIIQAGFVPPALEVMESGSAYNLANLKDNVTRLLSKIGIKKPMDMFMTPVHDMEPKKMTKLTGVTGSLETLRNCLTEITKSESSQALFVDRATFQGKDAGVIVISVAMLKGMDTLTTSDDRVNFAINFESSGGDLGALKAWVVGPDCGTLAGDFSLEVSHLLN